MAKTEAKQRKPSKRAATKAFERAWKLLGRLEDRLTAARADEARRRRQLAEATGPDVARRQAQLDAAVAAAERAAALLTELSELIAANARAQAGQIVIDVAHDAAQAVKAEEQARTAARNAALAAAPKPASKPARPQGRPTRARTAAPKPAGTGMPRRSTGKPAVESGSTAQDAAAAPATGSTPARARRRAATPRAATPARPRTRRSLQPGQPDPDDNPG